MSFNQDEKHCTSHSFWIPFVPPHVENEGKLNLNVFCFFFPLDLKVHKTDIKSLDCRQNLGLIIMWKQLQWPNVKMLMFFLKRFQKVFLLARLIPQLHRSPKKLTSKSLIVAALLCFYCMALRSTAELFQHWDINQNASPPTCLFHSMCSCISCAPGKEKKTLLKDHKAIVPEMRIEVLCYLTKLQFKQRSGCKWDGVIKVKFQYCRHLLSNVEKNNLGTLWSHAHFTILICTPDHTSLK